MMASLPTILLILAGLSLAATGIAALVAFRSQREAHSAIFPIVREEESSRAQRARVSIFVWTAVTALFLGGWLATLQLVPANNTPQASSVAVDNQPDQTNEVALTNTTSIADSPESSLAEEEAIAAGEAEPNVVEPAEANSDVELLETAPAATQPPTAIPTETPVPATPTPTATPTPALGALVYATTGPRTPAPANARIGPIKFASEMTSELEPVETSDFFANGVETIYAVFPFSGMSKGLDFTIIWYQNGEELAREEGEWEWGEQASSYTFLRTRGEGLYKLELYVNDTVVASDLFEIK
ncbi:MAG: hypothetical protein KDJ65_21490 [Anaerolineae bacterium]|nr:hypothetical protein [Anaerolineae bacterium]